MPGSWTRQVGGWLPNARRVFRMYNLQAPVNFSVTGNEVVLCMEPADLGAFKKAMESPATGEAMAFDGVKRETVKMFVLDKEVRV